MIEHIPLSAFRGWLKQVSPLQLNSLGQLALTEAFPFFAGTAPSADELKRLQKQAQDFHIDVLYRRKGPKRRFEGDESLPRGRYYSVCSDAEGTDGGTL